MPPRGAAYQTADPQDTNYIDALLESAWFIGYVDTTNRQRGASAAKSQQGTLRRDRHEIAISSPEMVELTSVASDAKAFLALTASAEPEILVTSAKKRFEPTQSLEDLRGQIEGRSRRFDVLMYFDRTINCEGQFRASDH